MNIFSTTEQLVCESLVEDLIDTYGSTITIYKNSEETLISQNSNFNFAFQNPQPGTTIQYIPQSGTFKARIKYLDNDELKLLLSTQNRQDEGQTQLRLLQSKPTVRIKVGADAMAFLGSDVNNTKRVQFDGDTFVLFLAPRLHGLFNRNYTNLYLQKTE